MLPNPLHKHPFYSGITVMSNGTYTDRNGNPVILNGADKYIIRERAISQQRERAISQQRERSASQQIENNSKRINTLLDNAAKTLKTSTETPTAAVYAKNSKNIQSNLDVLLEQTQQNKQTHYSLFLFYF